MRPANLRGHGLLPFEQEIMDRHDDGISPDAIAANLAVPVARVQRVIDRYCYREANPFEADARRGSAALLDRIRALQARQAVAA